MKKTNKTRQEVSSGGFVYADCQVLVVRDSYGRWTIPKGHIELGEDAESAAVREIKEETGLTELKIVDSLPINDYVFTDREGVVVFKKVHLFLVETSDPQDLNYDEKELTGAKFVDVGNLAQSIEYRDLRDTALVARDKIKELCKKTS